MHAVYAKKQEECAGQNVAASIKHAKTEGKLLKHSLFPEVNLLFKPSLISYS